MVDFFTSIFISLNFFPTWSILMSASLAVVLTNHLLLFFKKNVIIIDCAGCKEHTTHTQPFKNFECSCVWSELSDLLWVEHTRAYSNYLIEINKADYRKEIKAIKASRLSCIHTHITHTAEMTQYGFYFTSDFLIDNTPASVIDSIFDFSILFSGREFAWTRYQNS